MELAAINSLKLSKKNNIAKETLRLYEKDLKPQFDNEIMDRSIQLVI
jgi:hypothetical protein